MTRKPKAVSAERMQIVVRILKEIKNQGAKEPLSRPDIAASLGMRPGGVADALKVIEKRQWASRRTGPEPRAIYYKIGTNGRQVIRAWDYLFG